MQIDIDKIVSNKNYVSRYIYIHLIKMNDKYIKCNEKISFIEKKTHNF